MIQSAMAYFDESGDLGWKLDLPFQSGGSSRHFVIAMAIGVRQSYRQFGKVIDDLHRMQQWTSTKEKKWKTVGTKVRLNFCQLAAKALANSEAKVFVAVCHKQTAPAFMRTHDARTLHPTASEARIRKKESSNRGRHQLVYSMMVAETLSEHLPPLDTFTYCADELNESVRTLDHLMAYKLQFQDGRKIQMRNVDYSQAMAKGLTFADMIAGAVLESYERGDSQYLNVISPYITIKDFKWHEPLPSSPLETLLENAANQITPNEATTIT